MGERKKIYAFIDSQNLNFGTSKDIKNSRGKVVYKGWRLDYKKLRRYLSDKFRVQKAFLFIGYIKEYKNLYDGLKRAGFTLIYKPTVRDGEGKPKGNVDAELVLYAAAIEFNNYDEAVIVSGDGDFRCLYEFLKQKGKLGKIVIPNRKSASSLLIPFESYKVFIERERTKLEHKKQKRET